MTAAHTAVLRKLYDCLNLVDVALHRGEPAPGEFGDTEFAGLVDTITVDADLGFEQWLHTFAHELVHVGRGPCLIQDQRAEERRVAEETARLLVPPDHLPAILEAAKPAKIAADLGITEEAVELAIELARRDNETAAPDSADTEGGIA